MKKKKKPALTFKLPALVDRRRKPRPAKETPAQRAARARARRKALGDRA